MKFIDEKGRLFGVLNLIDLLVLLLAVAVVFVAIWKLGGKKVVETAVDNSRTVQYDVLVEDVPMAVAEFAQSQLSRPLVNNSKELNATIISVNNDMVDEDNHTDLTLTIRGEAQFSGNVYVVGTQEVRVGFEYIAKTSELELTGIIAAMEVTND